MYPKIIENLLEQLSQFPGIGRRSAERIVFWLLKHPTAEVESLAHNLVKLKNGMQFCSVCNNLSEEVKCIVCSDDRRDQNIICVVESPKELLAIERSGSYRGVYHVLLGTIDPSEGRGPDDIKIKQLLGRVQNKPHLEVVIATDPDNDGEMTALYLIKELKPLGVKVSRIGMGLPMGSSLEYADISTLAMSLNARREIHS